MTTLGKIISLQRGYDLTETQRRPGSVPIVGSAGIHGYHDAARAKGPGITLGRSGASFGKVTFIREDFWPHNTTIFVTDFKGNEPMFVRYLLESLDFSSLNSGSAQPSLNRNYVYGVPVRKVALPVQRKIAEILSAYDELIENNTRRIKLLEQMAQALYHEWFVSPCQSGKLPKGWETHTFAGVCGSLEDGDWIETKDQGGDDYRLLQVSNVGVGTFVETGNFRYVSQETFEQLRCREVVPGDILVARMPKPTGRAWLVTRMPWKMITAVDVAIAKVHAGKADPFYVLYYLNSPETLAVVDKQQTGTTRARISRKHLGVLRIVVPPLSLQKRFGEFAGQAYRLATNLYKKNANLRRTRDLLLPKLISGEVDVAALEIETGERAA